MHGMNCGGITCRQCTGIGKDCDTYLAQYNSRCYADSKCKSQNKLVQGDIMVKGKEQVCTSILLCHIGLVQRLLSKNRLTRDVGWGRTVHGYVTSYTVYTWAQRSFPLFCIDHHYV